MNGIVKTIYFIEFHRINGEKGSLKKILSDQVDKKTYRFIKRYKRG